jgi:TctA family transporter
MLDAALGALQILLQPEHFLFLFFGVIVGLFIGILPGLGGMVGMALLMPLTYGMDPVSGVAMLIGLASVITTSDTFPSVLMGIPGSSGSQATIMDGYPLAQKGEGARALSAAFICSLSGGIIGAILLSLVLPFAVPIVLALGTPELLMITLLGLGMVAVLSGRNPVLGLLSTVMGLVLGSFGAAPTSAVYRFTLDTDYLLDGIKLTSLAIGLFAIPEFIALLSKGGAITNKKTDLGAGWMQGLRDVMKNKLLVVRHALIGAGIGFIPGLGNAIIDWINYGLVIRFAKDKSQFGRGDIRGVIAPESANNAKEGGALIPTILFGIPGSGSMALLLAALVIMGVEPGPDLILTDANLVYVIVWSIAIANVLGAAIAFILSGPISRLAVIPFYKIMPFILLLISLGAFQATNHMGDLFSLLVFGVIGCIMRQTGIPRAPMLIGFVLSTLVERYLWQVTSRYGMDWVTRPGVLIIGALMIVIIGASFLNFGRRKSQEKSNV